MLGGNLPVSAPLQSYSKLDYTIEFHLVTYTVTILGEQKKRGINKPILRTNYISVLTSKRFF